MAPTRSVASICPKRTTGTGTEASYGYNPAVDALVGRMRPILQRPELVW